MKNNHKVSVKKITTLGVMAALSVALAFFIHIPFPPAPFLEYDPADIPIFIVSFIFVAYVAGKIVEKNGKLSSYIIAALVGLVINYGIGTNWMYYAYKLWFAAPDGFTYKLAWIWMIPPLPKDIFLSVLAGMFGHRMFKVLKVRRG